jgi:hypothetical protein
MIVSGMSHTARTSKYREQQNKEILYVLIYTINHGQQRCMFNCLFVFIPSTN